MQYKVYFTTKQWSELLKNASPELQAEAVKQQPALAVCLDAKSGDGEPGELNLNSLTVAELKEHAANNGVDLGEATKKADIIAAITAANN